MAPFLTHLAVGERVWAAFVGQIASLPYGTFLFGCLAPDVDKFCDGLEQGTTHFLAKDEAHTHVWRRSQHFLDHQADFLRAPFPALEADERAFVLGYLCHVATDEVTGRYGLALRTRVRAAGVPFPHVDAFLTAMDPRAWAMTTDPAGVVAALEAAPIPGGTLTFAPPDCLVAMHRIVLPQVREGGGLEPYLHMMRRQRQWLRYRRLSDAPDDPDLEAELATYRRHIDRDLPASERLVAGMELKSFVRQAVYHSGQRIQALLNKEG